MRRNDLARPPSLRTVHGGNRTGTKGHEIMSPASPASPISPVFESSSTLSLIEQKVTIEPIFEASQLDLNPIADHVNRLVSMYKKDRGKIGVVEKGFAWESRCLRLYYEKTRAVLRAVEGNA